MLFVRVDVDLARGVEWLRQTRAVATNCPELSTAELVRQLLRATLSSRDATTRVAFPAA